MNGSVSAQLVAAAELRRAVREIIDSRGTEDEQFALDRLESVLEAWESH